MSIYQNIYYYMINPYNENNNNFADLLMRTLKKEIVRYKHAINFNARNYKTASFNYIDIIQHEFQDKLKKLKIEYENMWKPECQRMHYIKFMSFLYDQFKYFSHTSFNYQLKNINKSITLAEARIFVITDKLNNHRYKQITRMKNNHNNWILRADATKNTKKQLINTKISSDKQNLNNLKMVFAITNAEFKTWIAHNNIPETSQQRPIDIVDIPQYTEIVEKITAKFAAVDAEIAELEEPEKAIYMRLRQIIYSLKDKN